VVVARCLSLFSLLPKVQNTQRSRERGTRGFLCRVNLTAFLVSIAFYSELQLKNKINGAELHDP
jgi:hypothetical protein